ncbi:MAG TPA: histidine kinase, partial [Pseudosphingobacterium sp.]|nr:histidine kinase [Pseudosphingobacterium sp.]
WFQKGYIQEIGFFIGMFILTMLHEWIQVDTVLGFIKGLVFFLILYAQAQLHRYFVFPLLIHKRYAAYSVVTTVTTLIGALLLYAADYIWIEPGFYREESIFDAFIYHFVICVVTTMTIMTLFLIRQYSMELKKRNEDRLLLNEMNIRYLHAQLNPHFFFNMFNNLYGASLSEPDKVPELILSLSNLMRYQVENGAKATVDIYEEVKFIENYISMEKQRVGRRCDIEFVFTEDKKTAFGLRIPPLILITLVENAFKHSITIEPKWFVRIQIDVSDSILELNIKNSMPDKALRESSTGLGHVNIRERLELLYKGDYNFETSQNEVEFRTNLRLRLTFA